MSIQAIAWVLEEAIAEMADRLVLLAIANHCDAHWTCFPSIELIAAEARVSRRTVFRCIDSLVLSGELAVTRARGRGHRNSYQVAPAKRCQVDTFDGLEKVSTTTLKGATGGTQTISNRSTSRTRVHAREAWEAEGLLEAIPEEQRKAGLAAVQAIKARA